MPMSKYKFTNGDDTTVGGTVWVEGEWREASGHPAIDLSTDVTHASMAAFDEDLNKLWHASGTNGPVFYDSSEGWFISTYFDINGISVIAYDATGTKVLDRRTDLVKLDVWGDFGNAHKVYFLLADENAVYIWFGNRVVNTGHPPLPTIRVPQMLRYDKMSDSFSLHTPFADNYDGTINYIGQDENYQIVVGTFEGALSSIDRTTALVSKESNTFVDFVPKRGYINGTPITDREVIGTSARGNDWVIPYNGDLISIGARTTIVQGTEYYPNLGKSIHYPPQEFYAHSGAAIYRMNYEGEIIWSIRHPMAVGDDNFGLPFEVSHAEIGPDEHGNECLWAWVHDIPEWRAGKKPPSFLRLWKVDLNELTVEISKRVEYFRTLTRFVKMGNYWYCADHLREADFLGLLFPDHYTRYSVSSIFAKVNHEAKVVRTAIGLSEQTYGLPMLGVATNGSIVVVSGSSILLTELREDLWT